MRRRDWQLAARRVGERARRIDVRKPTHAVAIGLIIAGIVAPVLSWMGDNERYRLDGSEASVITKVAPHLKDKLAYEQPKQQTTFNSGGQDQVAQEAKDVLTQRVGGAEKKATQLYTATFPNDASTGISVNDNVNKVPVTFKPLFGVMGGRDVNGHVVYPLKNQDGQVVYTPKANALKEDIVLNSAPADRVEYQYELTMPKYIQARLDGDGSVGFYSADPILFGNITFGTDKDKNEIDTARQQGKKTYEMFKIPAPTIIQSGASKGNVAGRFELDGNTLTLSVFNLKSANFPVSIDPTFYITSTADFLLGSSDDNVDLSVANQVGRATLDGGQLAAWTQDTCPGPTTINIPVKTFSFGLTAYNGYMYMMGGGNTASNTVYYADINLTSGAVGCTTAWTQLTGTPLQTARVGMQAFGYNGFLYAVGGEDSSGNVITVASGHTTEYAKLQSDGTIASNAGCGTAWCYGNSLNTARAFFASAIYQGVIYVFGGATNDNPIQTALTATVEYSRINGDGSVGTWSTTTSMLAGTGARDRFAAAAYNGYVYVAGGETGTPADINNVEYAPINSDGTLGSWVATTAFPTARRDFGFATERGHMYVYGGCPNTIQAGCTASGNFLGDTQYAVINADGTLGNWQQTANTAAARGSTDSMATTFYNGHLYSAGGCGKETAASNNCSNAAGGRSQFLGYTTPNSPGSFDGLTAQSTTPYNPTNTGSARYGGQAIALNGYVYYIGGTASTTGATYSNRVDFAAINADGSLAAWGTPTTSITSPGGNSAGRVGFTLAAFDKKIYVIGGVELNAGARTYVGTVISNTQNSDGTLSGSWTTENALPAVRAFHTTVLWNNVVYVIGGRDSTTVYGTIYYHALSSAGAITGAWSTVTNSASGLTTARWGHSSVVYGNYLYAISGETNTTGTLSTSVEQLTITSSGNITASSTSLTAIGTAVMYARAVIHNDFLYVMGGSVAGTTQTAIQFNNITPSSGALNTWQTAAGSTTFSGTNGLNFARGGEAAVAVDGYVYAIGGCHTTESVTVFDNCTTIVTATTTTETEVYQPNNGGTGQTTAVTSTGTTALTNAKADAAGLAYNGYIYTIGGCTAYTSGACTTFTNEIRYAPINSDGSMGSWSSAGTATLTTATSLLQAVAYNGFMYILGGQTGATGGSGGAVDTVYYGAITSTGTVPTLTTITAGNTGALPDANGRRNFGAATSNGYIYAVGGEDKSGTKLDTTEYAQLSSVDGSVGAWTTSTTLATTNQGTTLRSGSGVVAYAGNLYVVGGTDNSGNTLQDIQYAPLNSSTGAIGSWANTTAMPRGTISRQVAAANGYMYFFGNEGTTIGGATEVSYAAISSNGTIGLLHDQPNTMSSAQAHGSVAFYNGVFYLLGACTLSGSTCGTTPSNTVQKAGQKAISRAAHYSKLWDTQGVDTAPSQIVLNGSLQGQGSAVAATLRTAATFSTSLGVAQVVNPVIFGTYYRIYPLDSSGTNIGVAKTYALYIKLDDTQEGTFPDVTATQTAVSDITLYYHANPSRRLRHGASFSNVGCNINPANGCILDTAP
jgi:hypothetical protein